MAKIQKPRRPKAETPRGFRDYAGAEVTERAAMLKAITGVYHRYGFDPLETSAVETLDALGKHLPDVDRPDSGVFNWSDSEEPGAAASSRDNLALRYDLTAPLARFYAQNHLSLPTPYRRYAVGPVWRNEKPGPGRFRQFYQCDADTVGSASPAADAEICAMLADALEAAGIARGDYLIRINNRKVLNGVMEAIAMSDRYLAGTDEHDIARAADETRANRIRNNADQIMRTLDKFDKVGIDGVRDLLRGGRKDQSGAFIEGVGLFDSEAEKFVSFVTARGNDDSETLANLRKIVGDSSEGLEGVDQLESIAALLDTSGYADRTKIDPSIVRGLGYYTGPVYEAELTLEITDEKGRKRQFGSVAGGGRYDDLVMRFTGQRVPGTGVSIGVDRLLAALQAKRGGAAAADGPVLVTVMEKDRLADYQAMTAELRAAGIRAEMFLGGGNMAKQLKYADKRGAPVAIIEGGDEREAGIVQLKDLALGARLAAEIETNEEWKAQPAQIEAPRAGLVEAVRAMLARGA